MLIHAIVNGRWSSSGSPFGKNKNQHFSQDTPPMTIDPTKLRKGDKITVELTVAKDSLDRDGDVIAESGSVTTVHIWVHPSKIISHTPRGFEVGDRVMFFANNDLNGTILFIYDDRAWVKWDNAHGGNVWPLSMLIRLP